MTLVLDFPCTVLNVLVQGSMCLFFLQGLVCLLLLWYGNEHNYCVSDDFLVPYFARGATLLGLNSTFVWAHHIWPDAQLCISNLAPL